MKKPANRHKLHKRPRPKAALKPKAPRPAAPTTMAAVLDAARLPLTAAAEEMLAATAKQLSGVTVHHREELPWPPVGKLTAGPGAGSRAIENKAGVITELQLLETSATYLHEVITGLENRLGHVLRVAPTSPPASAGTTENSSQLAADLAKLVLHVTGAIARIVDLTQRLDV